MDLRGRSIRISKCAQPIKFKVGDCFEVRTDGFDIESSDKEVQINYFDLPPVMREGDIIIIGGDNGQVKASVTEIARTSFGVKVEEEGYITTNDILKIPGSRI